MKKILSIVATSTIILTGCGLDNSTESLTTNLFVPQNWHDIKGELEDIDVEYIESLQKQGIKVACDDSGVDGYDYNKAINTDGFEFCDALNGELSLNMRYLLEELFNLGTSYVDNIEEADIYKDIDSSTDAQDFDGISPEYVESNVIVSAEEFNGSVSHAKNVEIYFDSIIKEDEAKRAINSNLHTEDTNIDYTNTTSWSKDVSQTGVVEEVRQKLIDGTIDGIVLSPMHAKNFIGLDGLKINEHVTFGKNIIHDFQSVTNDRFAGIINYVLDTFAQVKLKVAYLGAATDLLVYKDEILHRTGYDNIGDISDNEIKWTFPSYNRHGVYEVDGVPTGSLSILIDAVTDVFGFNTKYVSTLDYKGEDISQDLLDGLDNNEYDMVFSSFVTLEGGDLINYNKTLLDDHLSVMLYKPDGSSGDIYNVDGKIGYIGGTFYKDAISDINFPESKTVAYDSIQEIYDAAEKGEIDAFIGSDDWRVEDVSSFFTSSEELQDVRAGVTQRNYLSGDNQICECFKDIFVEVHDNVIAYSEWAVTFNEYLDDRYAEKLQADADAEEVRSRLLLLSVLMGAIFVAVIITMFIISKNNEKKKRAQMLDTTFSADPNISFLIADFVKGTIKVEKSQMDELDDGQIMKLDTFLALFKVSKQQFHYQLAAANSSGNDMVVLEMKTSDIRKSFQLSAIYDQRASVVGFILRDITEDIKAKEVLKEEIKHDKLTGLISRSAYKAEISEVIKEERVGQGVIMFMDINGFKQVNDKFGHDYGDILLETYAQRMRDTITAENSKLIRISGDEFIVFVPNVSNEVALEKVNKLYNALSEPYIIKGARINAEPSIGYSLLGTDSQSLDQLLLFADFAMYKAKDKKKTAYTTIHRFDLDEYKQGQRQKGKERSVKTVIEEAAFDIVYQPLLWAKDDSIFAFEALARPQKGPNIGEFVEIASDNWLLKPMSKAIHKRISESWIEKGNAKYKLFINEPPFVIYKDGEESGLKPAIKKYGAENFVIEIIEQFEHGEENIHAKIEMMQKVGLEYALDDFGSGHANLLSFNRMKPNYVKLDRNLVMNVDKDEDKRTTLAHLVSFFKEIGIYIIAEGIETAGEDKVVKELGVDIVQGYFYGKPSATLAIAHKKAA